MVDDRSLFEQAADALSRAMRATEFGEQTRLMEEALRLNRLALAGERAKLVALTSNLPATASNGNDEAVLAAQAATDEP